MTDHVLCNYAFKYARDGEVGNGKLYSHDCLHI